MLVDFTQTVPDFQGQPILEQGKAFVTYQETAIKALISGYENEVLVYEAKVARVSLANKIKGGKGAIEITFAEACLIFELVSRMTVQPLFTFRFAELFDQVYSQEAINPATPTLMVSASNTTASSSETTP